MIRRLVCHPRSCQVLFVLGSLPTIYLMSRGEAHPLQVFAAGFNIGAAIFWELYLRAQRRVDFWMNEAMKGADARLAISAWRLFDKAERN